MTLNLDTGKTLWDTRFAQIANGDATVSKDLVFATTFDGYLLALARNDGQAVCRKKLPAFTNAPIPIEGDTLVTAASYPGGKGQIPEVVAFRLGAHRCSRRPRAQRCTRAAEGPRTARRSWPRTAARVTRSLADLQADVDTARASAQAQAQKLRESADANKNKLSVWWNDLQRSWNGHVAKIRDDIDTKRAEHDADRAEKIAEKREDDAAFAVQFAYAAIEEAETMSDLILTEFPMASRHLSRALKSSRAGSTASEGSA